MCVLVVEDELLSLLSIAVALEDAGFTVKTAENGREALKLLGQLPDHFSCLLTDFNMPGGISGSDLIMHMRRDYPTIPIILMSALPDAVTHGWRQQHTVDFLPKPFGPEELIGLLSHRGLSAEATTR